MPAIEANWMNLIGERLRADGATITREELPRRWVDLLQYLNERERQRGEGEAWAVPREEGKDRREK
jgi:hypothetical protein